MYIWGKLNRDQTGNEIDTDNAFHIFSPSLSFHFPPISTQVQKKKYMYHI